MGEPLVSCLMVTRNRSALARRAVHCLARQTWPNKELVILDDGSEDYEPMLAAYRSQLSIHYHRIEEDPGRRLGALRNLSLDKAQGDYVAQWDDDEWYHPTRLERQMEALGKGLDAVVLRGTLVHLDLPGFVEHPFRVRHRHGTVPGSVVHRRSAVRYPNLSRAEDSEYLNLLEDDLRVGILVEPHTHLFIRCFHGKNTWELDHFESFLRNTRNERAAFWVARNVLRNVRYHPSFWLTKLERQTAASFLAQSRELGVFQANCAEARRRAS